MGNVAVIGKLPFRRTRERMKDLVLPERGHSLFFSLWLFTDSL
jgi:hypothetical protein